MLRRTRGSKYVFSFKDETFSNKSARDNCNFTVLAQKGTAFEWTIHCKSRGENRGKPRDSREKFPISYRHRTIWERVCAKDFSYIRFFFFLIKVWRSGIRILRLCSHSHKHTCEVFYEGKPKTWIRPNKSEVNARLYKNEKEEAWTLHAKTSISILGSPVARRKSDRDSGTK